MDILPESSPTQRLRPLFTIGVHDIPFLMEDREASKKRKDPEEALEEEAGSGWVACTTDSILAMKDTLWDMLITMPPNYASNANDKVWPQVEYPKGKPVKATQRDLRRYNALRSGLGRLMATTPAGTETGGGTISDAETWLPVEPGQRKPSLNHTYTSTDRVAEPPSWAALAYNGFMWWASAGEQLRSEEHEESQRDAALLADLSSSPNASMSMPAPSPRADPLEQSLASLVARRASGDGAARLELAIIAYFHRLTTQLLSVVGDAVERTEEAYRDDDGAEEEQGNGNGETTSDGEPLLSSGDDDSADESPVVTIDSSAVEAMGLDIWSANDALFVQQVMRMYFGEEARVEGRRVEVCGVRVC